MPRRVSFSAIRSHQKLCIIFRRRDLTTLSYSTVGRTRRTSDGPFLFGYARQIFSLNSDLNRRSPIAMLVVQTLGLLMPRKSFYIQSFETFAVRTNSKISSFPRTRADFRARRILTVFLIGVTLKVSTVRTYGSARKKNRLHTPRGIFHECITHR